MIDIIPRMKRVCGCNVLIEVLVRTLKQDMRMFVDNVLARTMTYVLYCVKLSNRCLARIGCWPQS